MQDKAHMRITVLCLHICLLKYQEMPPAMVVKAMPWLCVMGIRKSIVNAVHISMVPTLIVILTHITSSVLCVSNPLLFLI